jgi:signal transduction histidine kinase/ActR/RegA family two-component response regulator
MTGSDTTRLGARPRDEARTNATAPGQCPADLEVERRRLWDALNHLPAYLVLLSPDHHVPLANRFFEERFGKAEGRRCYEYLFQRTEPCERCESFVPLETGEPHRWEWTGPDGRTYDIHDIPFKDSDGSRLVMEVGLDVTEVRQAQVALARERQRLFDVLERLPAMICLLTKDHQVPFANRAFRERFGEARGRRCYEYCFGRQSPCEFCETYSVLETGKPHHWEVDTADGSVIEVHDFPFTDADGSPMILEMDIDVTERRRAERELRTAHGELARRADQLRRLAGELTLAEQRERRRLATVLHDHLQQLLVGARLRSALIGRTAGSMAQTAGEIEALLSESIEVSRSLTSELSPPISHEGGLRAALEWLARWMADKHGLAVALSADVPLPPLLEDVTILLFESVRELLFNAVKHARAATAAVSLRLVEGEMLQITVGDSGPGFAPAALQQVGGIAGGFGLISIRERLSLFGGRMEIDSTPGGGSRVMLIAPLSAMAAPQPARHAGGRTHPHPGPSPENRAGDRIRVLLADDHAVVREGLAELLETEPDVEVVGHAADGWEAVQLAATLRPNVVLMDMSMPGLDGVEATRAIHRDVPNVRVIGLSMFGDRHHIQAMHDAGAVGYLTKSAPTADLIAAVRGAAAHTR